jgi:hypothetical protein
MTAIEKRSCFPNAAEEASLFHKIQLRDSLHCSEISLTN